MTILNFFLWNIFNFLLFGKGIFIEVWLFGGRRRIYHWFTILWFALIFKNYLNIVVFKVIHNIVVFSWLSFSPYSSLPVYISYHHCPHLPSCHLPYPLANLPLWKTIYLSLCLSISVCLFSVHLSVSVSCFLFILEPVALMNWQNFCLKLILHFQKKNMWKFSNEKKMYWLDVFNLFTCYICVKVVHEKKSWNI